MQASSLAAAILWSTLAMLVVGCAASRPVPAALTVEPPQYGDAFDAAVDSLRDRGFTVARRDYRFGLITTQPLPAPTALEPWRGGNVTAAQALRATVNDVRRTASITLRPIDPLRPLRPLADSPGDATDAPADVEEWDGAPPSDFAIAPGPASGDTQRYAVEVEVLLERLQSPVQRIAGSARAGIFSPLSRTPDELAARGVQRSYWEPIGRDPYLEQRLTRAIGRRVNP